MKRAIIAIVAVALVAGGVWVYRSRTSAAPAENGPRTARATRGSIMVSVSATGTVQPFSQVEVRSRATGTVVDVRVQEGDRVAKGQLLVVIDDTDARAGYQTSQAQLAQAQARLQQARSQLASTRGQGITRVAEAQAAVATARARLNQSLAGARPEQLDQAREALRQAELGVDLARQNLDRTRNLYNDGLVARAQLDSAQNQYDVAQAQVRAAQARLREVQAGNRPEDIEIARTQLRQADAALAQARAARLQEQVLASDVTAAGAAVRNAAAQAEQARQRLAEGQITAPIAGIVALRSVQVGQTVIGGLGGSGTPVMTIADTRVIQAAVNVDESDIARIKVGMPVTVTADALQGQSLSGTVTRIAAQAVVVQNVTQYQVVVEISNPQQSVRLGMTIDAEFVVMNRENVVVVPSEAVRGRDAKVVILVEGETLTPVVVETGATDGRQVEIVRGVQAGQTVYLGPGRQAPTGGTRQPQQTNPFMPQFPRRTQGR